MSINKLNNLDCSTVSTSKLIYGQRLSVESMKCRRFLNLDQCRANFFISRHHGPNFLCPRKSKKRFFLGEKYFKISSRHPSFPRHTVCPTLIQMMLNGQINVCEKFQKSLERPRCLKEVLASRVKKISFKFASKSPTNELILSFIVNHKI